MIRESRLCHRNKLSNYISTSKSFLTVQMVNQFTVAFDDQQNISESNSKFFLGNSSQFVHEKQSDEYSSVYTWKKVKKAFTWKAWWKEKPRSQGESPHNEQRHKHACCCQRPALAWGWFLWKGSNTVAELYEQDCNVLSQKLRAAKVLCFFYKWVSLEASIKVGVELYWLQLDVRVH